MESGLMVSAASGPLRYPDRVFVLEWLAECRLQRVRLDFGRSVISTGHFVQGSAIGFGLWEEGRHRRCPGG